MLLSRLGLYKNYRKIIISNYSNSSKYLPVIYNKNETVIIKEQESDPDLKILIKNYLSKDSNNYKIINFIKKLEFYEKYPDLQTNDIELNLDNKETTNLINYIGNNLNKELSDIIFYGIKSIYKYYKSVN